MKEWARAFYKSGEWKRCREDYAASVGGLCERCLQRGVYKPGEIVHHKVHLTPDNIHDPGVTLNWDNLELVCRDCHAELHEERVRRYRIAANGSVTARGN